MIQEAALILISCVLFIQMGLSEAIQEVLGIQVRFISCPKCLTFWVTLTNLILHGYSLNESVAVSFLSAYLALWLSLLYDYMATVYNQFYEYISKTQGTESDSLQSAGEDEVPKM